MRLTIDSIKRYSLCLILGVMQVCLHAVMPERGPDAARDSIHVIPALSSPSVKNGERVTISAAVNAAAGVAKVEAEIVRKRDLGPWLGFKGEAGGRASGMPGGTDSMLVARLELRPAGAGVGGVSADRTRGLWTAEWIGAGLEETYYRVILCVTDRAGRVFQDATLEFSDPIAGNDTPGVNAYPNGALLKTGTTARFNYGVVRAVVDPTHHELYTFSSRNAYSDNKVTLNRFALGEGLELPNLINSVNDNQGFVDGLVDRERDYLYLTTDNSRLTKVDLTGNSIPHLGNDTVANFASNFLTIDAEGGFIYAMKDVHLRKLRIESGDQLPTLVQSIWMIDRYSGGLLDKTTNYLYLCSKEHATIAKVTLTGGPTTPGGDPGMGVASGLDLSAQVTGLMPIRIDTAAGLAWFVSTGIPAKVLTVSLGEGDAAPSVVSVLTLADADVQAVVDIPDTDYALLGTESALPGRILKIDLGGGESTPTLTATTELAANESKLLAGGFSPEDGIAVFVSADGGQIIKVDPGEGAAAPERIVATNATIPLEQIRLILTDPGADYGLLVTQATSNRGRIQKVMLGDGETMPYPVGPPLILPQGQDNPLCGLLDAAGNYAYICFEAAPGVVAKYAMGALEDMPRNVGATFFESGEQPAISAVIDHARNQAWFGTNQNPGRVVKMALGDGDNLPTRLGAVSLASGESAPFTAVIDAAAGYGYFGTNTSPGGVVNILPNSLNFNESRAEALT